MIAVNDFYAFRSAAQNGHFDVVNALLKHPSAFAHVEMHNREYGVKYIHPFVHERLTSLRAQRVSLEANNPGAVFDINDSEEAKLCFYILRNLIRRNNPGLLDEIRFLIEIPSVKALLHTAVTPNQPNELLRLALSTGNQAGAEVLLTVPAVHALAVEHDFYRREARGGLDLNALARDRESSMTALTSGEQKRLDAAIKAYQSVIKARGIVSLMKELRDVLLARYEKKPAQFQTGDGRTVTLPATWDAWCALRTQFNADTQERALQAYAEHKDHSAWRYLEKPNPWMAEDAPYVNRNALGGYSTFEDYQSLIAMFFLAASDENTAPSDGYTFETRLEHFIDELAHIGRAHNWDKSREKIVHGLTISEEYDDLEGDKPSCYSGVKRRLFQSVLGHPLLKILTMDTIKQELREFVRDHVQQCIQANPEAAIKWKEAWNDLCESGEDDEALSAMDISEEKQTTFIDMLREKYPSQFDEDLSFKTTIQDRFKFTQQVTTHAARFGGEIDLTALLEPCVTKKQLSREELAEIRLNSGFYTTSKPAQSTSSSEEETKEQNLGDCKRSDGP